MQRLAPTAIADAIRALEAGGTVAHATETCYGLACDATNPEAVRKLFAIKQRPIHQPVSVLFRDIDQAKQYVEWNETAERLANEHLPGPLTLILKPRADVPHALFVTPDGADTIGVRISPHLVAQALTEGFDRPLTTTSANLHGQFEPYDASDIIKQFAKQEFMPDILLDSGALPRTPPSTIVDSTTGAPRVIRQGSITIDE